MTGCSICGRVMVNQGKRVFCAHCDTAICQQHTMLPPKTWRVNMDQRRLGDGDPQAMP